MAGRYNKLAVYEHLVALYFILTLAVPVGHPYDTAAFWHRINPKLIRSSAWFIRGAGLKDLQIDAGGIKREPLLCIMYTRMLSRKDGCRYLKTKAGYAHSAHSYRRLSREK